MRPRSMPRSAVVVALVLTGAQSRRRFGAHPEGAGRPARGHPGSGAKATSKDFLLRAYYLGIDFKTARGGTGDVEVRDFLSFRDPDHRIGFPIVNETTQERELTGEGDVGLGNPFRVTCESVEAIYRNPGVADDNEFILVELPGLKSRK